MFLMPSLAHISLLCWAPTMRSAPFCHAPRQSPCLQSLPFGVPIPLGRKLIHDSFKSATHPNLE